MADRIHIYDTTLRDGAQTRGVDFNVSDKAAIARELDRLGVDTIEGGWPGANPTDDAFFATLPRLQRARFAAFGMTRRPGRSAANDPGLAALAQSGAPVVTIVGKTWDFQVDVALGVAREENLRMVADSVAHLRALPAGPWGGGREVMFDAEHFFDGWKANPGYALECLRAALDAGARWLVLCDTNGGTLPHEVERIVGEVARTVPGERLGIHCHNDAETAVANSLAAVRAGARQVQGTINGLGERCGNANLISVIPALALKMGLDTGISAEGLAHLTRASRVLDERLNRAPSRQQAYVGDAAFAHKGGLHVSAVERDPRTYEHVPPESVGNQRHFVVSDQAGRSNVIARLREVGLTVSPDDAAVGKLVELVKRREHEGFAYDGAEASFELMARRALGLLQDYFQLASFRVIDERRWNARGELVTLSEATVKLEVDGQMFMTVAEGNGPVNALDSALRKVLTGPFPALSDMHLIDYKVRILTPKDATAAVTRVTIESTDSAGATWTTVGVSANVIDASYNALHDAITYALMRSGAKAVVPLVRAGVA